MPMVYYDIHTHQLPVHPEDRAIVNTIVGTITGDCKESPLRSCGIHPGYIQDVPEQLAELRKRTTAPDVVAIGEAGFDKRAKASMEMQQEVFFAQARLAEEVRKPLIIHCVKAWDELMDARKTIQPSVPWLIHGFRGNELLAAQLIRQGLLLSFGAHYNEKALQLAWTGAVFAETDDQPVDIRTIYGHIALSLNQPVEVVALKIQENILRTFSLPRTP